MSCHCGQMQEILQIKTIKLDNLLGLFYLSGPHNYELWKYIYAATYTKSDNIHMIELILYMQWPTYRNGINLRTQHQHRLYDVVNKR